jgi:hypothetical protein
VLPPQSCEHGHGEPLDEVPLPEQMSHGEYVKRVDMSRLSHEIRLTHDSVTTSGTVTVQCSR